MTNNDYFSKIEKYKEKLKQKFIHKNSRFKKGDFVQGTLGIIKITHMKLQIIEKHKSIEITYIGVPYKKIKNELLRTKQYIKEMTDYGNLKKLNIYEEGQILKIKTKD